MKYMLGVLALTILAAAVHTANATYPVEGSWGYKTVQNGFTIDMTMTIQNNSVTLENVCTYKGNKASASANSQAQYDDKTLTVLSAAHGENTVNGLKCEANMQADTLNYVVKGNLLTFTHDGSTQKFVLKRK
jgi:hypothetical protein